MKLDNVTPTAIIKLQYIDIEDGVKLVEAILKAHAAHDGLRWTDSNVVIPVKGTKSLLISNVPQTHIESLLKLLRELDVEPTKTVK